jgi:hypothetical protein
MVMSGAAGAFDKNSKGSARLRVQPKKKIPAGFWKGSRWYEVHVGAIPGKTLVGSVDFIFGAHTTNMGPTLFAEKTRRILQEAAAALGEEFKFYPGSNGSVMSLGRSYAGHFPAAQAGKDLASLIEITLPRLTALNAS